MLTTRGIARQSRTVQLALGIFRYSLSDAESCQFRYILTQNPADIELYNKLIADALEQLKQIRALTAKIFPFSKNFSTRSILCSAEARCASPSQSLALEQKRRPLRERLKIASSEASRANMLAIGERRS